MDGIINGNYLKNVKSVLLKKNYMKNWNIKQAHIFRSDPWKAEILEI